MHIIGFLEGKRSNSELTNVITKYFTHLASGRPFEARGLHVTGESRSGKTREINAAIQDFNAEAQILPDGQPARIVQCSLSGMLSWKDLGIKVLEALQFPMNAQRTRGTSGAKFSNKLAWLASSVSISMNASTCLRRPRKRQMTRCSMASSLLRKITVGHLH